jgi:hypothetical protein
VEKCDLEIEDSQTGVEFFTIEANNAKDAVGDLKKKGGAGWMLEAASASKTTRRKPTRTSRRHEKRAGALRCSDQNTRRSGKRYFLDTIV